MKRLLLLLLGLVFVASAHAEGLSYPLEPFSNPKTYKAGDWELRIYYRHKGTADEGMNGELLFQGKHPIAVVPPEYLETPFGGITFFTAQKRFKQLDYKRMVLGWTFIEYEKTPWTVQPHPMWAPRTDWRKVEPKFLP